MGPIRLPVTDIATQLRDHHIAWPISTLGKINSMITKHHLFIPITSLAIIANAHAGQEKILFSQLYNDNTHDADSGWNITGDNAYLRETFVGYHSTASFFSLTSGATLESIDIALSYEQESTISDVQLELQSGAPSTDLPDGTIITSGVLTVSTPFNSNSTGLVSFRPSQNIILEANLTYWIIVKPIMPHSYLIWNSISISPFWLRARLAESSDGITYSERWSNDVPAFRVTGVAVPEPSSYVFIASIAALTAAIVKRKFRASRKCCSKSLLVNES